LLSIPLRAAIALSVATTPIIATLLLPISTMPGYPFVIPVYDLFYCLLLVAMTGMAQAYLYR
jgi:hypothetical protein